MFLWFVFAKLVSLSIVTIVITISSWLGLQRLAPFHSLCVWSHNYFCTIGLSDSLICWCNFELLLYTSALSVDIRVLQGHRIFLVNMPSTFTLQTPFIRLAPLNKWFRFPDFSHGHQFTLPQHVLYFSFRPINPSMGLSTYHISFRHQLTVMP